MLMTYTNDWFKETCQANVYETSLRIKCYCPGHRVLKHCGKNSGTVCRLCTGSTYTDVPNGLTACLSCTVCDEGKEMLIPVT